MKYLSLNNNNKLPVIGLGTWASPKNLVGDAVKFAIQKAGYEHIDCASIYGNEAEIGPAFQEIFKHFSREKVFITSKLWCNDHRSEDVLKACKKSLSDLKLDYLDLYLVHWDVAFKPGNETEPVDEDGYAIRENVSTKETWEAMEELVKKGLVKSIGVANFSVQSIIDLLSYCKIRPAVNQIELHPYNTQTQLLEFLNHEEIAVTAYSPLGTPGSIDQREPILINDETVSRISRKHKKTPAQILLAWGLQRDTAVIPKSTNPQRISENVESLEIVLDQEDVNDLNALNRNYRFVDPYPWWKIPYFS